jgi:nicotinate-nucleotide--dimethylbenzimidazole phosphoribosyltransferase
MNNSIASEEQLIALTRTLPAFSEPHAMMASARQAQLTKPPGSLGRLEEIAIWLAGWQASERPRMDRILTLLFAGNHGVAARGVSVYPSEVTAQMVHNFEQGGAAVNQLCKLAGSELKVYPLSLDKPTADFTQAPAMSMDEALEAFNVGFSAVTKADLLVLGEMGIGNTTPSAALAYALAGGKAGQWAGRGTGVDDKGVKLKADVIQAGIEKHKAHSRTTLELLRRLGGREHAAMAGAIVRARMERIPVLLDGYVVTAAAATLTLSARDFLAHCIAGHVSAESGHILLLKHLKLEPLLNLNMRLGEASGALVALPILRAAVATHNGMATFAEASVSSA